MHVTYSSNIALFLEAMCFVSSKSLLGFLTEGQGDYWPVLIHL